MAGAGVDVWLHVYVIYAVAALLVLAITLDVRIENRASSAELVRTRVYELPPARLVIHTVHVSAWLVCAAAALVALRYIVALFGGFQWAYAWTVLAGATLTAGAGLLANALLTGVVALNNNDPPTVDVASVATSEGLSRESLARLGVEQFPECLAFDGSTDLKRRFVLIGVGPAALGVSMLAASEWGRGHGLYDGANAAIKLFGGIIPALPPQLACVLGISAALALLLLVVFNGTYTLMPFPATIATGAGVGTLALWSVGSLGGGPGEVGRAALVVWAAFATRWGYDLVRAYRFKNVRGVASPIADGIARAVPFLAELRTRADCRLVPLDAAALCARITRGCRNVEEASLLVTRNFARFLSLVRVEHEHFTAAMLRYLTVRRYLTSVGGGGTSRPLQNPDVPIWNELLFPVRPPAGFQELLDLLRLGSQWDVVCICGGCGGSGQVSCYGCGGSGRQQRSETYSEYSGGKPVTRTRTVTVTCTACDGSGRVTCSACSGAGRLVYHRTLNTQWQRLIATCTAPHVDVPELMENAEERTYCRIPLVENRVSLQIRPEHDGIDPDLETRLAAAVDAMGPQLPRFAGSVQQLHDGILYRSDFRVTGFHVIRIAFDRLRGHAGWFFGRRPEFYFPTLPLSWSTVCTILFVLPFVAMTALLVFSVVREMVGSVLPPIY